MWPTFVDFFLVSPVYLEQQNLRGNEEIGVPFSHFHAMSIVLLSVKRELKKNFPTLYSLPLCTNAADNESNPTNISAHWCLHLGQLCSF